MATSADAFLADLEDLEEDFDLYGGGLAATSSFLPNTTSSDLVTMSDETLNPISQLLVNTEFNGLMAEIDRRTDETVAVKDEGKEFFSETDEEYKLVSKCNVLVKEIEEEILLVFNEVF